MEEKLGEILDRLEYLVRQKHALGLKEGIGENLSSHRMPITCPVDEFGVYGKDDDKEVIMRLAKPPLPSLFTTTAKCSSELISKLGGRGHMRKVRWGWEEDTEAYDPEASLGIIFFA
ncbi:hypothetical protein GH714_009898 [Hevea brasiliensis]|uniref:Uncharacterized protein n=1 Tax=Hevea brasiliensis TaxID=3981 RepID=A0A6A6M140_HEVBR|nr:hypothetical protein GH714_009898 [Hevea brasiliensis]